MPIYEFYCSDCHVIYNFLSRNIDTHRSPTCPKCGRKKLDRRVSRFAIATGLAENNDEPMPDIDEAKMERAMAALAQEAEGINEDDPRQVGQLMRKLYDATGLEVGPGMQEAITRMESGEDPDAIEQELGDILEHEDPFTMKSKVGLKQIRNRFLPPTVDDTLYPM